MVDDWRERQWTVKSLAGVGVGFLAGVGVGFLADRVELAFFGFMGFGFQVLEQSERIPRLHRDDESQRKGDFEFSVANTVFETVKFLQDFTVGVGAGALFRIQFGGDALGLRVHADDKIASCALHGSWAGPETKEHGVFPAVG
jgi:hypothetical protein